MNYVNNNTSLEMKNSDLKSQLMDLGMYEEGMALKEMQDLFKTIKNSEESASAEKEYRATLDRANKNCVDLIEVMQEIKTPDKRYNLRSSNESFKDNNIEIDDTTVDIDKIEDKNEDLNKEIETVAEQTKNIDVFMLPDVQRKHLKMNESKSFIQQPFYCDPLLQNIPVHLVVQALKKYHECIIEQHKNLQKQSINLLKWGNDYPCPVGTTNIKNQSTEIDVVSSVSETKNDNYRLRSRRNIKRKYYVEVNSDDEEQIFNKKSKDNIVSSKLTPENDKKEYHQLKDISFLEYNDQIFDELRDSDIKNVSTPKRVTRRKDSSFSSDEEPSTTIKVSAIVHYEDETSPKKGKDTQNWVTVRRLKKTENTPEPDIVTITESETECTPPKSAQKRKPPDNIDVIQEEMDVSPEESFVRRRVVPPNPMFQMSQRSEQKIKNLSARRKRTPNSITKPDSQKTTKTKDPDIDEDLLEGITTNKFYGKVETRSIKTTMPTDNDSDDVQCPICDHYFSASIIEKHAATCTKVEIKTTENGGAMCSICMGFILTNFEQHVEQCKKEQIS